MTDIAIAFTPVGVRPRRDGWTAAKQRTFLAELARHGRAVRALLAVGMSKASFHRLLQRPDAASFYEAYAKAMMAGRRAAKGETRPLYRRAVEGIPVMRRWQGKKLVSHYRYSGAMLCRLIALVDRRLGHPAPPPGPAAKPWFHDDVPSTLVTLDNDSEGYDRAARGGGDPSATPCYAPSLAPLYRSARRGKRPRHDIAGEVSLPRHGARD